MNRADGLQGPLIVKERAGTPALFTSDADKTLFLSDFWHFTGNAMALRLNRWDGGHGLRAGKVSAAHLAFKGSGH